MLPHIPHKSSVFPKSELKILRERLQGLKKDPHGTFAGRVKPKIIELLEWFKFKKNLEKLVKPRNKP